MNFSANSHNIPQNSNPKEKVNPGSGTIQNHSSRTDLIKKVPNQTPSDSFTEEQRNEKRLRFGYFNPEPPNQERSSKASSRQSIAESYHRDVLVDNEFHIPESQVNSENNLSQPTFKPFNLSYEGSIRGKEIDEYEGNHKFNQIGQSSNQNGEYSVEEFIWRLNKDKSQFKQQMNEALDSKINKFLPNSKTEQSSDIRSLNPQNKNRNILQETSNDTNFDNILQKQQKFYNMLTQNQILQSKKSLEGDPSLSPPKKSQRSGTETPNQDWKNPSLQHSLLSTSYAYNQSQARTLENSMDRKESLPLQSGLDQSSLETEIVKLNKKIKDYENVLIEKQEESEALRNLLNEAKSEIENLKDQREKDLILMTEINEKYTKDKKKLQSKLDQVLDKLLHSSNISVTDHITNRVNTPIHVLQTLSNLEEEKVSLQNKLDQAYKELEFQKKNNESLRRRITTILIQQEENGTNENSQKKELSCLLKEYTGEIEDLRNINKKLEFVLKQTKAQSEDKENYLTKQLEETDKKLRQVTKEVKPLQKEKERFAGLLEKIKQEDEIKTKEYEDQIAELQNKIEKLKEEKEKERKLTQKLSEIKFQGGDNIAAIKEIYEDQMNDIRAENDEIRARLNESEKTNKALISELKVVKELNEAAQNMSHNEFDLEEAKAIQRELETTRQGLKRLEGVELECNRLQEEVKQLKEIEAEFENLKEEMRKLEETHLNAQEEIQRLILVEKEFKLLQEKLKDLEILQEELLCSRDAHGNLKQKHEELLEKHKYVEDEHNKLKQSADDSEKSFQNQYEAHKRELAELLGKFEILEDEKKKLISEKDMLGKQVVEMETLKQDLEKGEQNLKEIELERSKMKADLENYANNLKKVSSEYEAKLKKANDEISSCNEQIKMLTSNKNTDSVVKELRAQNEKAKEELNKLRKTMDQKVAQVENESFMQKVQNDQLKAILEDQDKQIKELQLKITTQTGQSKGTTTDTSKKQIEEIQQKLLIKEKENESLANQVKELKNELQKKPVPANTNNNSNEIQEELDQQKLIVDKQKTLIMKNKEEINDLKKKFNDQKQFLDELNNNNSKLNSKIREQEETIYGYEKKLENLLIQITELSTKEQEYLQQIRTLKNKK